MAEQDKTIEVLQVAIVHIWGLKVISAQPSREYTPHSSALDAS